MDSTRTEEVTHRGRGDRPGGAGGVAPELAPVRVDGRMRRGGRGFPSAVRTGGRVPGVDGLRALAVVLVMVYHLEPDLLPGGALGVDVFFAISGYVITRLLLAEFARTGDVAMRAFYWRRWLRLVPALLAVCATCAVLALTTRLPSFERAWTAITLAATFLMNIVRAAQSGTYSSDLSLLSHTWSLGVEEQFYLLWPPLLLLLLRRVGARTVLLWTATLCLLPLIWRSVLWEPTAAHRIYNGMDTRADQLLTGALLALVVARLHADDPRLAALRRWAGRLAWPALALLALIVWQVPMTGSSAWTMPWYTVGFLVAAVLSATLVASLELGPRTGLSRALSLAPLVWVGRNLSYGLYLWHYPLTRLMSDLGLDAWHGPATFAASFAAAVASHYLIERPLTRRGRPAPPPKEDSRAPAVREPVRSER
ncbi:MULTISPECIES: acyltransferase family protein [unclassified Streptomyces]|uniref:acyltransferase family protein n=1 Tax=unclassified Streptomyces TaxID=2593676 RepID=UPI002E27EBFF|nr:acyltransferase [Streptomyces sp. NBC_01429]